MKRQDKIGDSEYRFGDMFLVSGELYILGYDATDIPPCIKLGLQDYTDMKTLTGRDLF